VKTLDRKGKMSIYRNSSIKQQMLDIYEKKIAKWPVVNESVYVDTTFGRTHILSSGSTDLPPLILLPGLAMTSAVWLPNIGAFSRDFHCFAVDVIGDYGKSELADPRHYPRVGKDYSTWLRQVFEGLGLKKANLAGLSHGGFAAINHAIFAPEQIEKLILMAPSGLELSLKKVLPKIFYYLIFPSEKNRISLVDWFLGDDPTMKAAFFKQLDLGLQGRPKVPIPLLVSGNKLRRISRPVMLLLGEKDVTTNAERAKARMKKNLPTARIEVISGVGHGMNYEATKIVNRLVLDFLEN